MCVHSALSHLFYGIQIYLKLNGQQLLFFIFIFFQLEGSSLGNIISFICEMWTDTFVKTEY